MRILTRVYRCDHVPLAVLTLALAVACSNGTLTPNSTSEQPLFAISPPGPGQTYWDFVQLNNAPIAEGAGFVTYDNSRTVTNGTLGSVKFTATLQPGFPAYDVPEVVFAWWTRQEIADDEKGVGICRHSGNPSDLPKPCYTGGEVGTTNETKDLILDLTGLASGVTAVSVRISSLQVGENYRIAFCPTSTPCNVGPTGTGAAHDPLVDVPIPSGTQFVFFRQGATPGAGGNDYLVAGITTIGPGTPGKTFSIGPSSMEGAIKIANGDWVNGGYSFKFKKNTHSATSFTVAATVTITGPCTNGGTDTFTLTLPTRTYTVPAGNTDWLPTGDQNSVLSWQGSAIASGLCGGGSGKLNASKGAVYTATVSQNPATGSLVDFRFKYRDPAAKGKPNTNCLNTSDPNRNKADVCGASWSQTVTDP